MRRFVRAALVGLAGCALIFGASQAANGDSADITYPFRAADITNFRADDPDNPRPFDNATGTLRVIQAPDETTTGFKLTVNGIKGAEGQEFGAHLHTGPCVDFDYADATGKKAGSQAGPHYNHERASGNPTPAVNTQTEVWFNLVPNDDGNATDNTKVSFVPYSSTDPLLIPGEMSVVIHALPTNTEFGIPTASQPAGYAGDRWACFKLMRPDNWPPNP